MVNIHNFENSIKPGWMKKVYQPSNTTSSWYDVLLSVVSNINRVTEIGGDWFKVIAQKLDNPFWKHVFSQWGDFCSKQTPEDNSDIIQSSLWFNSQISRDTMCFPDWQKNGIQLVGDLVDNNGKIISYGLISTPCESFWQRTLNMSINDNKWPDIYKTCIQTVCNDAPETVKHSF